MPQAASRPACAGSAPAQGGRAVVTPNPNRIAAAMARAGYTLVLTRGREPAEETAEAVLTDYRARRGREALRLLKD